MNFKDPGTTGEQAGGKAVVTPLVYLKTPFRGTTGATPHHRHAVYVASPSHFWLVLSRAPPALQVADGIVQSCANHRVDGKEAT